jgi:hypothetical protein
LKVNLETGKDKEKDSSIDKLTKQNLREHGKMIRKTAILQRHL